MQELTDTTMMQVVGGKWSWRAFFEFAVQVALLVLEWKYHI